MANTDHVDFSTVPWGSVEWTNLVTLYLRAYESRSPRTILGDHLAAAAVDRITYDFDRMRRTMLPAVNQYVVALRARRIDDWCAAFLRRQPDAVVLHLGCGLDARAFRLAVPESVHWYDVDQPSVIALRRRLYEDTGRYRMIGTSVTSPHWLTDIATGRPALVVAEGLLMYLTEGDVRQLLRRLTDQFTGGEMLFDTTSPFGPVMSRVFTKGIVKWGIRDVRALEAWNPRLHALERRPVLADHDRIPVRSVRLIYKGLSPIFGSSYDVLNRFGY